jgi:hypothetical protein
MPKYWGYGCLKRYRTIVKEDPIYEKIAKLFDGKISESYTEERLQEIFKEGEERFKSKIPPGYEDEKNKEGNRMYGDLILWKQVIDKAKKEKRPVMFITDERKSDWWWKIKDGRNMGPRQELVAEIKKEANVDFHMYSSERFLSYGQDFLKEHVNQRALEEIQAIKRAEIEYLRNLTEIADNESKRKLQIKEELQFLQIKMKEIVMHIYIIEKEQENLRLDARKNLDAQEYIHRIGIQKEELESERMKLKQQINSLLFLLEMGIMEESKETEREQLLISKRIRERKINREDDYVRHTKL